MRDYPSLLWMVLAVIVALGHRFIADSRWLMVHLVLLGALSHAIIVWSSHFSQALLKNGPRLDDRRIQNRRLILLFAGTAASLVGVPTAQWWLVVAGATLISAAVIWHGVQLIRRLRVALPGRFRVTIRYYLAAAACLPVGAALGATLAYGLGGQWHGRVLLAHTMVNVLGWVGLTVTGTLLTLWPTMLRTRIDPRAERRAQQAFPAFVAGLLLVLAGVLADERLVSMLGLAVYAAALLWWALAVLAPVRSSPPREFAPASVGAAIAWWIVGIVMVLARLATTDTWAEFASGFGWVSAVLAVGFAAQLLSGALSYLVPSVLGGGKSGVRASQGWLDRHGAARLLLVNGGLLLCLAPVPSWVRVAVSVVVLAALAMFIPLLLTAIVAAIRARRRERDDSSTSPSSAGRAGPDRMPSIWTSGQLITAVATLALAVAVGVGVDPSSTGAPAAASVEPTGETTTVQVEAEDMHFSPSSIEVPAGDRLVIELTNADDTAHDLSLLGETTPRLKAGETATLDAGVVAESTQGWCTIAGHRQMGMVLDVEAVGAADGGEHDHEPAMPQDAPIISPIDPSVPARPDGDVHRLTLKVTETELEVAPGVKQVRWTFNGRAPGPVLRGEVGDEFDVTLVNDGTIGHSVDFHAGALAPDEPMRTIEPGESLRYRFTAERAGVWMYHCSTPPMSTHIAAGMHGAVIIEPEGGLPKADREYLLVQSETFVVPRSGTEGEDPKEVDSEALMEERPSFVSFNGIAEQYDQHPLTAKVGERVRFWVLDSGPNRAMSFHVIGGQFDTVYAEGAYRLGPRAKTAGAQALGLQPAQGGFVELTFPEPGHYPVVSHVMADAELGAHGIVEVTK